MKGRNTEREREKKRGILLVEKKYVIAKICVSTKNHQILSSYYSCFCQIFVKQLSFYLSMADQEKKGKKSKPNLLFLHLDIQAKTLLMGTKEKSRQNSPILSVILFSCYCPSGKLYRTVNFFGVLLLTQLERKAKRKERKGVQKDSYCIGNFFQTH